MDELMLRRAQRGDPQAFEALVTPLEQMVWRVCWHYMGNREDAEDAMQETMLKAWRAIGGFRGECSLETWLYRVSAGVCTDLLRKKKLRGSASVEQLGEEGFEPADPGPQPQETMEKQERQAEIRGALRELPEDMRTALILSAVEGRSYEEIARVTGVPIGTVKSRIGRAREKLAKILSRREQNGAVSVQQSEGRAKK